MNSYGPNSNNKVNWTDVDTCQELARMYDTEDLTHPPHRPDASKENTVQKSATTEETEKEIQDSGRIIHNT